MDFQTAPELNWGMLLYKNTNYKPLNTCLEQTGYIKYVYYFDEQGILRIDPINEAMRKHVRGIEKTEDGKYVLNRKKCQNFPDYLIAREALEQQKPGNTVYDFIASCRRIEKEEKHQKRLLFKNKISDNITVAIYYNQNEKVDNIVVEIPLCISDMNTAYHFAKEYYSSLKKIAVQHIRQKYKENDLSSFYVATKYVTNDCRFVLETKRK